MKNIVIPAKIGVAGLYRVQVRRPDNSVRVDTGWFNNLITDQGIEYLGATAGYLAACQVGTGNSAPNVADTGLATYLAGSSTIHSTSLAAQGSSPYYVARTNTYRFAAGVATGNISEVGIGTATTGSVLFSRALILDGGGSPTTITVLADEVLDVTYQLRVYPPTGDVTPAVTDSGPAGTEHTFTVRAARVTTATDNGNGWGISQTGSIPGGNPGSGSTRAYNGAIGAITGSPAGTSDSATSTTVSTYVAASDEIFQTSTFGLDDGNLSGGITALEWTFGRGAGGCWQAGVSPAIPKTASETLSITTKVTWSRATI